MLGNPQERAELKDQSVTKDRDTQPPAVRCRHNTPATGYFWIYL